MASQISELRLLPEEMRAMGYRVIDLLIEHMVTLDKKPAMLVSSREALGRKLREPLPRSPSDFDDVTSLVTRHVFSSIGHLNHPRFFGFIPTPSNWVSVLADALAAGVTPFCGTWLEGSGPVEIELVTLDWLKELIGFPQSAGGLFVSGGSIANLTALAAARDSKAPSDPRSHVIYRTDQTHSSVDRALKILGYREDQIREVRTDQHLRLDTADFLVQIAADRQAGRTPHIVIGNAGTTNTGAVDPIRELAAICRGEDLWFHVDGAYGAAAVLSERGARLLDGIAAADSITLDPHKWLFQPYVIGCVLLRDARKLLDFFHVMPEYLQDAAPERGEINPCDYGPELTRSFRALKLWMSLKVFGADAFARAIDHGLQMAEATDRMLREQDCWEIVSPAQMAILCFRYVRPGLSKNRIDELNTEIAHRTAEDGCCFLSTTRLKERPVLRMCTIQPSTTEADLRLTIECLRACAEKLVS